MFATSLKRHTLTPGFIQEVEALVSVVDPWAPLQNSIGRNESDCFRSVRQHIRLLSLDDCVLPFGRVCEMTLENQVVLRQSYENGDQVNVDVLLHRLVLTYAISEIRPSYL